MTSGRRKPLRPAGTSASRAGALIAGLAVATSLVSCLPADDRPVPASVYVTVTGDETLLGAAKSTTSVDGWSLKYDRFLLGIGNSRFDEASQCASYYDADYLRVLDLQIAGAQKLGILYALGRCDFGFRVSGPTVNAVLGRGVTGTDLARLGTPGTDPYARNRGISLYVKGSASKGAVTKTFEWSFRQRVRYDRCGDPDGGAATFDLVSGAKVDVDLRVHGETPFLDRIDPSTAQVRFGPFALADDRYGNADGIITLDELGMVPLGDLQTAAGLYGSGTAATATAIGGDGGTWKSLEDYVYLGVFPRVVRFRDTEGCELRVGNQTFGR